MSGLFSQLFTGAAQTLTKAITPSAKKLWKSLTTKSSNSEATKKIKQKQVAEKVMGNNITKGKTSTSSNSGSTVIGDSEAAAAALSGDTSATGTDGSSDGTGSSTGTSSGTGTSGSSGSSGGTSPLVTGEMTFEELVGEICNGIDLLFMVKRNTVVVADFDSIYAEAKYIRDNLGKNKISEDISLWQLEDGSYELDVTEYGFYNTVKVNYSNGSVTESYEDYVRVYGEVLIEYDEPNIDKTTAIMKAKAYLAAHVREFDMTVKGTILHKAGIDIGDIVTLENPLTLRDEIRESEGRDPEYFFVMGNSINWDDDSGMLLNDIELRYGPESPDKLEVPEAGGSYSNSSSGDVDSAIAEVGQMGAQYSYCHSCQTHDCVVSTGCGDCFGMSDFLCCELNQRGVTNKIVGYPTSVPEHRSVLYQDSSGNWVDFPYREYGFNTLFNNTAASQTSTKVVPCSCSSNSTSVSTTVSTQTTSDNTQVN